MSYMPLLFMFGGQIVGIALGLLLLNFVLLPRWERRDAQRYAAHRRASR